MNPTTDTPARPSAPRVGLFLGLMLLLGLVLGLHAAQATDTDLRYFDKSVLRVTTGTADVDSADAVWTGFIPIITCTPTPAEGMTDVVVVIDLAKTTSGWATTATSETITFAVQRAVDGTNYRSDAGPIDASTAISGTNSAGRSITLHVGPVGPGEAFKIAAKLSAEVVTDTDLPYVVYYRAPNRATFTDAD